MPEDILSAFDASTPVFLFFLVLFIEAGIPLPIPHDVLILVAGYRHIPFLAVLVAVVLGNIIGSSILYALSWHFGSKIKKGIIRYLEISQKQTDMVERWYHRWGKFTLVIARLVPGARFAATFLAGSFKLSYTRAFLPYLSLGSILWVSFYWSAGTIVEEHIGYILQLINIWFFILGLALLGIIAYITYRYTTRKKNEHHPIS